MNFKLIFTTLAVAFVACGLQAMERNQVRRPATAATTRPAQTSTAAKPATTATRQSTTTQQAASQKRVTNARGRTGSAFF